MPWRKPSVNELVAELGSPPRYLVSNAAPPRDPAPFLEMTDATWFEDVQVILNASFILGQRGLA